MKLIRVKDKKELEQKHDGKIYCISDCNGNELFDVYEDSFIKMVDLGLIDPDTYQFIKQPTESEMCHYRGLYGLIIVFSR